MKTVFLALALGALLLGAGAGMFFAWREAGVEIPATGWWAIGVGSALTLLLGGGLMALTFYSARKGYDDLDRK